MKNSLKILVLVWPDKPLNLFSVRFTPASMKNLCSYQLPKNRLSQECLNQFQLLNLPNLPNRDLLGLLGLLAIKDPLAIKVLLAAKALLAVKAQVGLKGQQAVRMKTHKRQDGECLKKGQTT